MGTGKAGSLLRTLSGDSLMTGTARKRSWRLANPERSREHERTRALRRRQHGTVTLGPLGPEAFSYPSGISYQRYESQGYMWFSREKGEWLPYLLDGRDYPAAEGWYRSPCEPLAAGREAPEEAPRRTQGAGS